MKKICLLLFIVSIRSYSQTVFQPVQSGVYDFLDEMAGQRSIELNSVVKPYARTLIADKLKELDAKKEELNKRQQKELEFYLKDFNKEVFSDKNFKRRLDLLYYKDSLLSVTINPIGGFRYYTNNNGSAYHRWSGAEAWGYLGKQIGFYTSLRDNGVSKILAENNFLTPMQGANYKYNQKGGGDYSEMKGGLTYSWKWGSLGMLKDNFIWGNNYHGANIFSGKNPSFAYINFKLYPAKWIDFNYIHGWLVSEVIDSSRTYGSGGSLRKVYHNKYLAANMFTFKPFKQVHLSFGNSIIYSDMGVNPAYLIPFLFYKSVDHTYNGTGSNSLGQNSHMFFDISLRNIKHLHLYGTLFVDEVSISNMFDKEKHTNLFSMKAGARITNLIIPNTSIIYEYTRTNPWVYTHPISTTTFASNQYNMGHYLRDNAEEIYVELIHKPIRALQVSVSYTRALKGPEMNYVITNGVPNVAGTPYMEVITWLNKAVSVKAKWEVINDGYIYLEALSGTTEGYMTQYSPGLFQEKTASIIGGINVGF